jgi:hypothetical protein
MTAKTLLFHTAARDKILEGVNILDTVKVTPDEGRRSRRLSHKTHKN